MVEIKPLYLDLEGFPAQSVPGVDTMVIAGLTVSGTLSMSGQIDMGTNKIINLDTPTDPGDAASKGYVDSVASEEAERVENVYTAETGVSAGDPVYVSSNDQVSPLNAANNNTRRYIGVAKTTETATNPVDVVSAGVLAGVLTGATAGQIVWAAVGGGLTTTIPGSGNHLLVVGKAKNATDLHIEPQYLGKA